MSEKTPPSGYHRVTKVAKNADTAKTTKNCINWNSARPTPLHRNPAEKRPENTFLAQDLEKTKRFMIFDPPQKRGSFFDIFAPSEPNCE